MSTVPLAETSVSALPLMQHRPFQLYLAIRAISGFVYQMSSVAVGWQVYSLTGSAFALGMVGLVQFLPTAILVFVAGHTADRYNRQRVVQICQFLEATIAVFLAVGNYQGWLNVVEIYSAVTLFGTLRAFESPAVASLLPAVVPPGTLQRATAVSSGMNQLAIIVGPAIGGVAYAVFPGLPYTLMAGFWMCSIGLNLCIKLKRPVTTGREPPTLANLFAGASFVRNNPAILGTISLDLFAVLLGGATALLPIYARNILHTGPWGLGLLRGGPAIGALTMTVLLSNYTFKRRVGLRMFQAVILFGCATMVFAVSHVIWLSMIALVTMGAADTVSVVIRLSLVQLATPDNMRGRVNAVNYLFINASNQLGEFESGVTAALLGAMPAAFIGGIGTVIIAILWMKLFPSLRKMERLE